MCSRHCPGQQPALDDVDYLDAGTLSLLLLPRFEHCDALLVIDAAQLGGARATCACCRAQTWMPSFATPAALSTRSASATCSMRPGSRARYPHGGRSSACSRSG
ncbi:MAG: hypothetical protein IPJ97_02010 [Proteobacteria bacterium]|nr:hypothetical protein [Pseudomonadota bacterium]